MKTESLQKFQELPFGVEQTGSRTRLIVDNIKCGGCAKTIAKALNGLGFEDVTVNPESSFVEMNSPEDFTKLNVAISKLRDLGYPLIDTEEGLKALALKAKSYLSCAIGKIS